MSYGGVSPKMTYEEIVEWMVVVLLTAFVAVILLWTLTASDNVRWGGGAWPYGWGLGDPLQSLAELPDLWRRGLSFGPAGFQVPLSVSRLRDRMERRGSGWLCAVVLGRV